MEMGDNDSGGFGLGVIFDGPLVLIVIVIVIGIYCSAQKREQQEDFCAEVCSQYNDLPVVQGSQCYCRDEQGIYDPATPRTATLEKVAR